MRWVSAGWPSVAYRLLAAAATLVLLAPVAAASSHSPDQRVAGHVSLGSKQIPLPEGEWRIAGVGSSTASGGNFGAYGAIQNLIAFKVVGDRVDTVAEINANALPAMDGWGLSKQCLRSDLYLTVMSYRTGFDGACHFVKRTAIDETAAPPRAWSDAQAYATRHGLRLPAAWLTVGFRVFDRQDVVDVRYHFDPQPRGQAEAGAAEAWTPEAVKEDRGKFALVETLSLWASHAAPAVELGLRNRLTGASPVTMPGTDVAPETRPGLAQRLSSLDQLYAQQVISETQRRHQRDAILSELKPPGQGDWLSQSVKKNISFRVFGSFVDWMLAFGVTLSAPVSTGITASIVAIHSVIFVFNDRYWDTYWAERGRKDGTQLVDFEYVGGEA